MTSAQRWWTSSTAALCAAGALAAAPASAGAVAGKIDLEGGPSTKPTVVYVEKIEGAKPPPDKVPEMVQKDTQFAPDVLIVVAGQDVSFPNADKFFHNVFSVAPGNEFDLGMYRAGASKKTEMREPGEVDVYCNIHPGMKAKILVLQNTLYVPVKPDGTYKLDNVPPGTHTLVVWSPTHEPQKKVVEVKAAGDARLDAKLVKRKEGQHLNKNGEQYGRYK